MFTGIITEITTVARQQQTNEGLLLTFVRPNGWNDLVIGESIATNGVCLTITALRESEYDCLLMPETLAKTVLGKHVPTAVNLERSMPANGRFSGHFVQGHIDTTGEVNDINDTDDWRLHITFEKKYLNYVIPKGSIAINGVSLTIADVSDNGITVAIIPFTKEHTTLGTIKKYDLVNIEFDMLGKYAAQALNGDNKQS